MLLSLASVSSLLLVPPSTMVRMTHHDADYDPRWDDDDENYTAAEYGDDGAAESPRTRLACNDQRNSMCSK